MLGGTAYKMVEVMGCLKIPVDMVYNYRVME